jgi:hypothetical protein
VVVLGVVPVRQRQPIGLVRTERQPLDLVAVLEDVGDALRDDLDRKRRVMLSGLAVALGSVGAGKQLLDHLHLGGVERERRHRMPPPR